MMSSVHARVEDDNAILSEHPREHGHVWGGDGARRLKGERHEDRGERERRGCRRTGRVSDQPRL